MKKIPPHIFWPGMVIAILSMSLIANIFLVIASQKDGGARPIPHTFNSSETESYDRLEKSKVVPTSNVNSGHENDSDTRK